MKPKLSIGVCVLISLALVSFGLLFGTVRGFSDDREHATALLSGEGGLVDVLDYRGADGLNLCVVARRHLSGDADVKDLETAAKNLRSPGASLSQKKQEDARLSAAVILVADKLKEAPSFQQSERDKKYLDMLTTDLNDLARSAVIGTYNEAAKDFNKQLEAPISGTLATLLGVKPCELYQ